jgi:hypothetical protein
MIQPSYVEKFDAAEFPFHRERNGLVRYHETVMVIMGEDGEPAEVISGHRAVASAIVESWCADNPQLFTALIDGWIEEARAADDADKDWQRRWGERIAYNPKLAAALDANDGAATVCERAGLTPFQTRAVELMLAGKTKIEIGFALGITRQAAEDRINKALERIVSMDREELLPEGLAVCD